MLFPKCTLSDNRREEGRTQKGSRRDRGEWASHRSMSREVVAVERRPSVRSCGLRGVQPLPNPSPAGRNRIPDSVFSPFALTLVHNWKPEGKGAWVTRYVEIVFQSMEERNRAWVWGRKWKIFSTCNVYFLFVCLRDVYFCASVTAQAIPLLFKLLSHSSLCRSRS